MITLALLQCIGAFLMLLLLASTALAIDLATIKQRGVLRHLGVTYAHFVMESESGMTGLDVELMQMFARHLGVRYELVQTTWADVFQDLTGQKMKLAGDNMDVTGTSIVRGDIIANGLTVLPWREKIVNYSVPTFPTGVWLIARADSSIKPIEPSGNINLDIQKVMALLQKRSILTMKNTCLDPDLYNLGEKGCEIRYHTVSENLNDIAPAIINGAAEATLLDIPDALIALQKFPGEIKIIGPVSQQQVMAVAVAKSSPEILDAFNQFFLTCWKDGVYEMLVRKYYPAIFLYMGDFFSARKGP
jgi:ABC-type amino acid transport substrate-binding protein